MPRADVHGAYYCMGVFRTLTESYQPFLFWTARSTLLYFLTLFRSSGGPQSDSDGCPPGTTQSLTFIRPRGAMRGHYNATRGASVHEERD